MSRASDAFENRRKSERITAAEVEPGDIIAGSHDSYGGNRDDAWLDADAFRDVHEVQPEPQAGRGNPPLIRIRYTTARGTEHTRDFHPDRVFYRIAERPELPPVPEPQPDRMSDQEYEDLVRDRDRNARWAAQHLLPGQKYSLQRAKEYAREFARLDARQDAEIDARMNQATLDLIAEENAGGYDRPAIERFPPKDTSS